MKISSAIKTFLIDNQKYSKLMMEEKPSFFIKLLLFTFTIKIFFLYISPHNFPEELSFEKAGIISPSLWEYIIAGVFSIYLYFSILLTILAFNIKKELSFLKIFITNTFFGLIILLPFVIKMKTISIFLILILPFLFIIFSLKKIKDEYLYLLKMSISLHIITAIFAPLLYIGEISENETIYIIINLISAAFYFTYYLKMIKSRFDLSIPRILIYSLFPSTIYFIISFLFTKIEFFSSNISKLIIYQ